MNITKARNLDKFYTKGVVAQECLKNLEAYILDNNLTYTDIIEPSAGGGVFLKELNNVKINGVIHAFDIYPQADNIQKIDFLGKNLSEFNNKKVLIVGNPPFGKNSSLAVKFFNKSAEIAELIAFIVPKTFKKYSVKNKLNEYFNLEKEYELPLRAFEFMGEIKEVPCVFQIWKKSDIKRELKKKDILCNDYTFSKKENAIYAFQRVGVRAGVLKNKDVFDKISSNSHMFISFKDEQTKTIFSLIDWSNIKYNTAGNPSISKVEIKDEYIKTKQGYKGMLCDFISDENFKDMAVFNIENEKQVRFLENGLLKISKCKKIIGENIYEFKYNDKKYLISV